MFRVSGCTQHSTILSMCVLFVFVVVYTYLCVCVSLWSCPFSNASGWTQHAATLVCVCVCFCVYSWSCPVSNSSVWNPRATTSAPLCICANVFVCVFVFMKLSCVQSEWLNTTCNHALYALTDVFSQEKHFHPFYFLMRPSNLTSSSGPSQLHAAWSAYMYVCTYRLFGIRH